MVLPPQAQRAAYLAKRGAGMPCLDSYSLSINVVYCYYSYTEFTTYKDNDNFLSLQIPILWDIVPRNFPKISDCALGIFLASLHYEN